METLVFAFLVMFSDAPPVLTGLSTMEQCQVMRASVEPEILKLGDSARIGPCVPILIRRGPAA